MNQIEHFHQEVQQNINGLLEDTDVQALSRIWVREIAPYKYAYNFTWLGRPVIQFPQDMLALQEIVWETRPDLIVEIGVAHGGSIIYSASILELLGGDGKVLGVDIDIRAHNRREIERHPMFKRIELLEGSSVDADVARRIRARADGCRQVLVLLDSNHTHEHVLRELELYSPLVRRGGYLIVYDTLIDDMPARLISDRPWGPGNNPKTAVHEFLRTNGRFEIDHRIQAKLQITVAPDGYLRCIRDEE